MKRQTSVGTGMLRRPNPSPLFTHTLNLRPRTHTHTHGANLLRPLHLCAWTQKVHKSSWTPPSLPHTHTYTYTYSHKHNISLHTYAGSTHTLTCSRQSGRFKTSTQNGFLCIVCMLVRQVVVLFTEVISTRNSTAFITQTHTHT